MRHDSFGDSITLRALWLGVAIPVLYYGSQAVAAPFFPGFSFFGTTASELGSDRSSDPAIFNVGVMVLGAASLLAAPAFLLAFRRFGVNWLLAGATTLAVAVSGVQALWAGYFPLPDPRHGGHPVFLVFVLALPVLLAASTWGRSDWRGRTYYLANLVLLVAMVPVMSRVTPLDTDAYRGLVQRVFALAIFPPLGVVSYLLIRRLRSTGADSVTGLGAVA
ncbi:DUF998 domain-containing protein [Frigoriglobus tundricola]|uniref:DUF998 domain-containing protein n=1 Tax=Frigoriglobus tundricola TaxID=2774151 RepID=A0A6M5YK05_9BACT|nr:DUF998 domain-containing protein [Frigoriglobus tundricola]QJW93670.1 hypothetical protein FTUN_1178 [Frigoriglobus tundricola]